MSRWPRARDIVNANREFLETRARVQTDARRWHSDDKNPELLLPPGKRLAEGEELLLSRREEVDDRIVEYIEASSSGAEGSGREGAASRARAHRGRGSGQARATGARGGAPEPGGSAATTAGATHAGSRQLVAHRSWQRSARAAGAVVGFRGQQEAIRQAERAEENAQARRRSRGDAGAICGEAGASRCDRSTRSEKRGSPQSIALAVVSLAADCRERRDRGRNPTGAGSAADRHVVARPAVSARSGGGALQSALRAPANHGLPP